MKTEKVIKLLAPIMAATTIISPLLSTTTTFASENTMSPTNETNKIVLEKDSDTRYHIFDKEMDRSEVIEFNKGFTSATITNEDGTIDWLTKSENGNIYLNGELYAEKVYEPALAENKNLLRASNGYQYVTTFKTKQSVYRNTAALAATLAGFMGGPVGYFMGAAGVIEGLRNYGAKEVYIR
ncbi:hypothetical protein HB852_12405 [Listeria grandensis]|uniref:hypothetical protein n=1 Tax=Listeria grandensis TaxID=1494963 RepID=UPI001625D3C0|nr:hypothetical protein [Listeria grandensis]MBC1475415.1 hypothetical protein [Listeria grandensis]